MEQSQTQNLELLAEISAFCAKSGMSKSSFGSAAMGDPGLVSGLEGRREPRRATIRAIRHFMVTGERIRKEAL